MKEKELEDTLVKNLNYIEEGLILIERQKRVDTGIIDLYCKDKHGNHVIVEVKIKPDTNVVAQLARYYMSLLKAGINRNCLRAILVAGEVPKNVKEVCEFFNFEIRHLYKLRIRLNKQEISRKSGIPSTEELVMFIKKRGIVNYSVIANFYNLYNATVQDIIDSLRKKKLVVVKEIGANKIVMIRKGEKSE